MSRYCFRLVVVLLTTIHIILAANTSSSYDDYVRLYDDVIRAPGRDHRTRPIKNQSAALEVYVDLNVNSVFEIDEAQETIHLNIWMNFTWKDEIRTWDPSKYGNISIIHPDQTDIWRPKTMVRNSVGDKDPFKDNATPTYIIYDGTTNWFPGNVLHIYCHMDMTYFPFDEHECQINFILFHLESEIKLLETVTAAFTEEYKTNGEWNFEVVKTLPDALNFENAQASVSSRLKFKRIPDFYVMNILVPIMALSLLPSLVFILPENSGERASYATTILLALSVYLGSVTGELPKNSEPYPIILTHLSFLMSLSSCGVLVAVIQLRMLSMIENCSKADDNDKKKEENVDEENISKSTTAMQHSHVDGFQIYNATTLGLRHKSNTLGTDRVVLNQGNNFQRYTGEQISSNAMSKAAKRQLRNEQYVDTKEQNEKKKNVVYFIISNANVLLFSLYLLLWGSFNVIFFSRLLQ